MLLFPFPSATRVGHVKIRWEITSPLKDNREVDKSWSRTRSVASSSFGPRSLRGDSQEEKKKEEKEDEQRSGTDFFLLLSAPGNYRTCGRCRTLGWVSVCRHNSGNEEKPNECPNAEQLLLFLSSSWQHWLAVPSACLVAHCVNHPSSRHAVSHNWCALRGWACKNARQEIKILNLIRCYEGSRPSQAKPSRRGKADQVQNVINFCIEMVGNLPQMCSTPEDHNRGCG